jgi:hypothetical protein
VLTLGAWNSCHDNRVIFGAVIVGFGEVIYKVYKKGLNTQSMKGGKSNGDIEQRKK